MLFLILRPFDRFYYFGNLILIVFISKIIGSYSLFVCHVKKTVKVQFIEYQKDKKLFLSQKFHGQINSV